MKEYERAQTLLNKLIQEFKNGGLGMAELDMLRRFSVLQSAEDIEAALEEERKKNIKKYSLARHIKDANKGLNLTPGGAN